MYTVERVVVRNLVTHLCDSMSPLALARQRASALRGRCCRCFSGDAYLLLRLPLIEFQSKQAISDYKILYKHV